MTTVDSHPIQQSVVPERMTVLSTDPHMPLGREFRPYHCTDCGHVFPCSFVQRVGRCGICRGTMEPDYSAVYFTRIETDHAAQAQPEEAAQHESDLQGQDPVP